MKHKTLQMKQIVAAPWDGNSGSTYSVIGLAEDGTVWRYVGKRDGWEPYGMRAVACSCSER